MSFQKDRLVNKIVRTYKKGTTQKQIDGDPADKEIILSERSIPLSAMDQVYNRILTLLEAIEKNTRPGRI